MVKRITAYEASPQLARLSRAIGNTRGGRCLYLDDGARYFPAHDWSRDSREIMISTHNFAIGRVQS